MSTRPPTQNRAYKRYLLALLLVLFAFNWVDRIALGMLLQDIKADLHLNDVELGFMSGLAFAAFYSVMGLPIARWADRSDRITIIWVTAAIWSAFVALCGMASSFVQLLLIRIGVGVGEAGCGPPAHSLIADHFSRAERPRAAAVYSLGAPLSMVLGYLLAGWLNELYGWRITFVLLGAPGLALAVLAKVTLKEPRRAALRSTEAPHRGTDPSALAAPSFTDVATYLWRNRTFRHLLIGYSVLNFFVYGVTQWQPAFYIRSYAFETGSLGTLLAVINGLGGLLGTYAGGRWASHRAHDEPLHLRMSALLYAALAAVSFLIYVLANPFYSFALLGLVAIGYFATFGPGIAVIQTLVPERMRATAFALLYLFVNLIGIGLGPLLVGTLSELWSPWAGGESLRYALMAMSPGYIWVAWHVLQASRTVKEDIQSMESLAAQCAPSHGEAHAIERAGLMPAASPSSGVWPLTARTNQGPSENHASASRTHIEPPSGINSSLKS